MSRMRQILMVNDLSDELQTSLVSLIDHDEKNEKKNLFITRNIEFIAFDLETSVDAVWPTLEMEVQDGGLKAYNILTKSMQTIYPALFHGAAFHLASITASRHEDEDFFDVDEDLDPLMSNEALSDEEVAAIDVQEVEGYLVLSECAMPKWVFKQAKQKLSSADHKVLPVLIYVGKNQVEDIVLLANKMEVVA